jgi:hypothetical protein
MGEICEFPVPCWTFPERQLSHTDHEGEGSIQPNGVKTWAKSKMTAAHLSSGPRPDPRPLVQLFHQGAAEFTSFGFPCLGVVRFFQNSCAGAVRGSTVLTAGVIVHS